MKYSVLFAATAALALGACQKSETNTSEASTVEVPAPEAPAAVAPDPAQPTAAESPTEAAAFTVGEAPSKAFMVGIWGEGEGCELPINFQADGTTKDGPFEKWDIQDGKLVMEGAPQKMMLKVVDAKTMESQIEGSDKKRVLKRCG